MSEVRLVIRGAEGDWSGTIHGSSADQAIAALSADPLTSKTVPIFRAASMLKGSLMLPDLRAERELSFLRMSTSSWPLLDRDRRFHTKRHLR